MADWKSSNPFTPAPRDSGAARPDSAPSAAATPPAAPPSAQGSGAPPGRDPSGRVTHDERGNAVWSWVKGAGRAAIESTSRLLRKLEAPELKMEDTNEKLRLSDERKSSGGGYDPYNQTNKPRPPPKPPLKGRS